MNTFENGVRISDAEIQMARRVGLSMSALARRAGVPADILYRGRKLSPSAAKRVRDTIAAAASEAELGALDVARLSRQAS